MSQGKTGIDNLCGLISSEGNRGTKAEQLEAILPLGNHLCRVVKKLMRLRVRSISGGPQAVRDIESGLHGLCLG
jgi:hypothetical protein